MATAEELMAVIGSPADSAGVRRLIATDGLVASTEQVLQEGQPLRSYLSGPDAGYQLMYCQGRVVTAFLYAEPSEGFEAFPGLLPGGLSPRATRPEVLALFGTPERSGNEVTIAGLGRQGTWDRFEVSDVCIHFQYTEPGERVRLVSLMAAAEVP